MTLAEKKQRLAELLKIPYPSDQEYVEIEKLTEDIELIQDNIESHPTVASGSFPKIEESKPEKRQKKTILQYLKERYGEKPATIQEINQLKLDRARAILKRDIHIAKSQVPSKLSRIIDGISRFSNNLNNRPSTTTKARKSKKRNDQESLVGERDYSFLTGGKDKIKL